MFNELKEEMFGLELNKNLKDNLIDFDKRIDFVKSQHDVDCLNNIDDINKATIDAKEIINDFDNEEVISIFWIGGYDYVVYTNAGGYVYNSKTKEKDLCNPDGEVVRDICKNIYVKDELNN